MPIHVVATAPASTTFRACLQNELARRCGRNARYSLRAFANFLGIDHATLSQMLRGKRPITAATVRRLGARIGLQPSQIDACVAGLRTESPAPETRALTAEASEVFSQWHAFAILELLRLEEFRPDARWIARVLGISSDEVAIALQHLVRLGFLRMAARDRWIDLTGGAVQREEDFTSLALERLATRSRELQLASARNAPAASRFHGSATLALKGAQLQRLLAMTEKFVEDVHALAAGAPGDRIYQVDVHCLPLTTEEKER